MFGAPLLLLLSLAPFRLSNGVKCTTLSSLHPCMCYLSNGVTGIIDISPLFVNGYLSARDGSGAHFKYSYNPCKGLKCRYPCESGTCGLCQWTQSLSDNGLGIGSLESVKYTVNNYDPVTKSVSLLATYTMGVNNRISNVEFVYDKTATNPEFLVINEKPSETYNFRVVTNGPGVLISNNASLPSNSSGPYPIQRDACTRWSGSESVLAKAGLLKLFAQAVNLNYTWTKGEYKFEYFVGVCVPPVSLPLSSCYAVQKTTQPNGDVSFECLGGNVDVQVTDTRSKGWMLLSYTDDDYDAPFCDSSAKRTKIFFFCKKGAGPGTPLFIVQNPLQDDCFYQFNWPTEILCGSGNTTQPSPAANQSPISLESAVLIGLGAACFLLLAILLAIVVVATCCMCARRTPSSAVVSKYYRMSEP